MNAAYISATYQHHQNRLRLGVCGVVLEVKVHTKLDGVEFLGPMALLASGAGGDQSVGLHSGLNRIMYAVEHKIE
jgi:hypothetical protein